MRAKTKVMEKQKKDGDIREIIVKKSFCLLHSQLLLGFPNL